MAVRVVLAGAGHTHVELMRRGDAFRRAGYRLTVINPTATHPYSGMGPGVLGGDYRYEEILLPVADLARRAQAEFLQDRVVSIDAAGGTLRLEHGGLLGYDLLSLNLGSEVAGRAPAGRAPAGDRGIAHPTGVLYPAKPIESLEAARREIERRVRAGEDCRVAVVGGGPAGVELAANAAALLTRLGNGSIARGCAVDLFVATEPAADQLRDLPDGGLAVHEPGRAAERKLGRRLERRLAGLSGRRARLVDTVLRRRGVQLHVGPAVDPDALAPAGGYAVILLATGVRPPALLRTSGLPLDFSGAVRVDRFLRAVGLPNVFAVGDCASFAVAEAVPGTVPGAAPGAGRTLARAGVFAVRQQTTLFRNLLVTAEHISKRAPALPSADGEPADAVPADGAPAEGAPAEGGEAEQPSLVPFTGTGDYLSALNLGLRYGIAYRGRWCVAGKVAYLLKDRIDRSFVGRYRRV